MASAPASREAALPRRWAPGEPWNAQVINQRLGYSACITGEIWKNHPEKAFAMRADFVQRNPRAAAALTVAVIEAAQWCDTPANLPELANILGRRAWFNVPPADILPRMHGIIDFGDGRTVNNPDIAMKVWRDHASYQFQSDDLWFLTEDIRWGVLPPDTDKCPLVAQVNKEGVWRAAAGRAGVAASATPTGTPRGLKTFFDGKDFDPANPAAYLASLPIKRSPGA